MVEQQILQLHTYHCCRCTCHVHKQHQYTKRSYKWCNYNNNIYHIWSQKQYHRYIVQLTTSSIKLILKKHTFQHKYRYDGSNYKTLFPITLAYVITGHKSQGATISSKVIIDIKEAFAPGLTYVMFLKVTNINNLKIIGNLTPNDFIPCTFEDD